MVAKKRVIPQKVLALHDEGAMASDSNLDGEDYYIVEDANESTSSEYVPCINYPNDKVYPEDEKNGWVRLEEDTGPSNIYRFEGSCWNCMDCWVRVLTRILVHDWLIGKIQVQMRWRYL